MRIVRLTFSLSLSDFKVKTSFGFLTEDHGACILDFSEKSQNELVWQFSMFLAILVQESIVVRLYQILEIFPITCVKLVCANVF